MKISVITVSYNSAVTVADTIKSVSIQKYPNIEHLVIDGLSSDNTLEIINANSHKNLIVSSEKDMGIYDAMNKGITRATGEIIGFLNSDDIFADPDVLMRVADAFNSNPCVDACFGDLVYVSEDNSKVVRYWKSRPYKKGSFANGWCPAHPTFYIRRTALNSLGQFDLNYCLAADAEFMMRYLERGGIKSTYIPHIQVRMRLGGATNHSWSNIILQNREILQAFKKNGISYSLLSFVFHKLTSRVWQRLAVFTMLKST